MRIKHIVIAISLLAVSFSAGAFAATNVEKVEAFLRGDYQVFLNGKKVDVGPVLVYKGSSYLPLAKIGDLTDFDVKWNKDNFGIYLNARFAGQPKTIDEDNLDFDPIELYSLAGYQAKYRGGTYPVLSNVTQDYKVYYRDADIQRMGIDTRGLRKAYEKHTKQIYIADSEAAKAWKDKPEFTTVYEPVVAGETDPAKIKVITDFIEDLPRLMAFLHRDDPYYYFGYPQVFVIDALGDDEFTFICYENGKYQSFWIQIKQNSLGNWYYSQYTSNSLVNLNNQYQFR